MDPLIIPSNNETAEIDKPISIITERDISISSILIKLIYIYSNIRSNEQTTNNN